MSLSEENNINPPPLCHHTCHDIDEAILSAESKLLQVLWLTFTLNQSMQVSEVFTQAKQQVGIVYHKLCKQFNSHKALLCLQYSTSQMDSCSSLWPSSGVHHFPWKNAEVCTKCVHQRLEHWVQFFVSVLATGTLATLHQVIHGHLLFPLHLLKEKTYTFSSKKLYACNPQSLMSIAFHTPMYWVPVG